MMKGNGTNSLTYMAKSLLKEHQCIADEHQWYMGVMRCRSHTHEHMHKQMHTYTNRYTQSTKVLYIVPNPLCLLL